MRFSFLIDVNVCRVRAFRPPGVEPGPPAITGGRSAGVSRLTGARLST